MAHDEVRWHFVKTLLDEFPSLREKIKISNGPNLSLHHKAKVAEPNPCFSTIFYKIFQAHDSAESSRT